MLYLSLFLSSILLLATNLFAFLTKYPRRKIITSSLVIALGPNLLLLCGGLGVLFPPVLEALFLTILAWVWTTRDWRPRTFLALSLASTLLVYGILGFISLQNMRHLQQAFPYISMNERLAAARTAAPAVPVTPEQDKQLDQLENDVEQMMRCEWTPWRTRYLRALHEETVQEFVNQPGFGQSRMTGMKDAILRRYGRQNPSISQPGPPSPSPWLPELLQTGPTPSHGLLTLHESSVLDFVNPSGFGFIKDRQHVAGFEEHQIHQTPEPPQQWRLQRLDLVGLLLHPEPVAYVSDHLPRMDELRAAPTRPLDEFETAGLLALRSGDDLFVRDRGQERHMFGAIRAVRQCLQCHEVERGDLLGAFSYLLTGEQKELTR